MRKYLVRAIYEAIRARDLVRLAALATLARLTRNHDIAERAANALG